MLNDVLISRKRKKFSDKVSTSHGKRNTTFLITIWNFYYKGEQGLFSVSHKYSVQFLTRLFTSPVLSVLA